MSGAWIEATSIHPGTTLGKQGAGQDIDFVRSDLSVARIHALREWLPIVISSKSQTPTPIKLVSTTQASNVYWGPEPSACSGFRLYQKQWIGEQC